MLENNNTIDLLDYVDLFIYIFHVSILTLGIFLYDSQRSFLVSSLRFQMPQYEWEFRVDLAPCQLVLLLRDYHPQQRTQIAHIDLAIL